MLAIFRLYMDLSSNYTIFVRFFDILLTVHLNKFILILTNLMH